MDRIKSFFKESKNKLDIKITKNKTIVIIILSSLLIKLLIMPFFAHADFFSMARRVNVMIIEKNYFAQKLTTVTYFIHVIWFYIISIFNPNMSNILLFTDYSQSTVSLIEYYSIVGKTDLLRFVFFVKILFLIFDYGVFYILYKLFDESLKRKIVLIAWAFNPIIIYTSYVFGRYEVISIFFLALVLLNLKRNNIIKASCFFVILLFSREIFTIFIPVFLVSILYKNGKFNIKELLISSSIVLGSYFFISFLMDSVFSFNSLFFNNTESDGGSKYNNIFGFSIDFIYPAIISYVVSTFYFLVNRDHSIYERFCLLGLTYICTFYIFGGHSAHYVSWGTLLMVVLIKDKKHLAIYGFFVLSWLVFWLFASDEGVFTGRLALPLSFHFKNFFYMGDFYESHFSGTFGLSYKSLLDILHTIYATFIGLIVFISYKSNQKSIVGVNDEE